MSRKNKYQVDEVIRSLSKKQDCKIEDKSKTIYVINGSDDKHPRHNDLGTSSWGKIDFLVNYQGYKQYFVSKF